MRENVDRNLRTKAGEPMNVSPDFVDGEMFAEYIDWRVDHPSDDIMTELLNAEFEDETGTVRGLTREELLTYLTVIAGAGNETTNRLIGWTGKVLAEHPDQRKELVEDRSLIPNAVEELLRFEPPHITSPAMSLATWRCRVRSSRREASWCCSPGPPIGTIGDLKTATNSIFTGTWDSP